MNLGKIVGDNVVRLRDERHWKNTELAKAADLSGAVISLLCRGKTVDPPIGTLMKVARGLGVPLEAVIEGAEGADELAASGSERAASMALPFVGTTDIREELAETNERLARLARAVEKAIGRPLEGESQQRTIRRQSPGTPARLRPRSL